MVSYAQEVETEETEEVKSRKVKSLLALLDDGNIVDELPDNCAAKILEYYNDAKETMGPWIEKYKKAIRLAKLEPKDKNKTFPFKGASTAMAPFVLEAMIDFNARSAPELAYSDKIVKAKVYGGQKLPDVPDPSVMGQMQPEHQEQAQEAFQQAQQAQQAAQERIDTNKEDRAERVAEYSNYQLSQLMPRWKRQQDKLLLSLPCVGTMYKKSYYCADTGEVCSDLCYGDEIIFDQAYPTFEDAPDKFEELPAMSKNEVVEKIRGEDGWDIEETDLSDDDKETYTFIEAYTWLDVDEDGLKEPYCVTIWKDKEKCVYARPLFDEDTVTEDDGQIIKVEMVKVFTQYQFIPDPEGGPMGMGWGILLGPTFEEINKTIRQMQDAGTLQVLASNSGLIADRTGAGSRGNRAQRGPIEVAMGKLTSVQMGGQGSLSQDIVQFPAAGPSPELFNLLGYMVEAARRLTDASSQLDSNPNEAAALYLARLQQTLKRPNIIIMRVYDCAAKEFELIFDLNHKHFSDEKYNKIIDRPEEHSMKRDFDPDDCDIRLVADPSQGSDMERIARAETVLQNAKTEQQPVTDMRQATKDYYEVLGVADVDALVPEPQGPDPMQQMMEKQQQMEAAKEAMDAEFRNREQQLRERDQDLKEADQKLKALKQQLEAVREAESLGIETDVKEADIMLKYSQAFKNLQEIDTSKVAAEAQAIENKFINNSEGGVTNGASDTAIPASNPGTG